MHFCGYWIKRKGSDKTRIVSRRDIRRIFMLRIFAHKLEFRRESKAFASAKTKCLRNLPIGVTLQRV